MPMLAAAIPAISAISTIGGIGMSALGAMSQARGIAAEAQNAQALGQYENQQYLQEGYTQVASAQRKAEEQDRRGKMIQSQLVARAAGGGTEPSLGSTSILGQEIAGRNEYSSLMDLAHGQDIATGYLNAGQAAVYQGNLTAAMAPEKETASYISGASSIFGTLGKMNWGGGASPGATGFG